MQAMRSFKRVSGSHFVRQLALRSNWNGADPEESDWQLVVLDRTYVVATRVRAMQFIASQWVPIIQPSWGDSLQRMEIGLHLRNIALCGWCWRGIARTI